MSPSVLLILLIAYFAATYSGSQVLDQVYDSEDILHDNKTVLLGGLFPIHEHLNESVNCGKFHDSAIQKVESFIHLTSNFASL